MWNKCILHMSILDVSTGVKLWFDVTVLLQGSTDSVLTNDWLKQALVSATALAV